MEKMKKGPADVENQLHSWLQNVNGDASISDVFINNELLEASALPPRHILDIHENFREYFGEKILNIGRGNVKDFQATSTYIKENLVESTVMDIVKPRVLTKYEF